MTPNPTLNRTAQQPRFALRLPVSSTLGAMFVLPALIVPLVFALAIYRLYQVPWRLVLRQLGLPVRHRLQWCAAGIVAYIGLLAYTIFLAASLVRLFVVAGDPVPLYVSLLVYLTTYPVVYVAAAWVFYYALVPVGQKGAS